MDFRISTHRDIIILSISLELNFFKICCTKYHPHPTNRKYLKFESLGGGCSCASYRRADLKLVAHLKQICLFQTYLLLLSRNMTNKDIYENPEWS